jgi:hypothetical protein
MTKRMAISAAAGLALALAPMGVANAAPATASVTIENTAQYSTQGNILYVGVKTSCTGGSGGVSVQVQQYPPETATPVAAGSGISPVVCDGQQHETAVTIFGEGFDAGTATATATLTVTDTSGGGVLATATDSRQITIAVS